MSRCSSADMVRKPSAPVSEKSGSESKTLTSHEDDVLSTPIHTKSPSRAAEYLHTGVITWPVKTSLPSSPDLTNKRQNSFSQAQADDCPTAPTDDFATLAEGAPLQESSNPEPIARPTSGDWKARWPAEEAGTP